jgi:hypothetical protein
MNKLLLIAVVAGCGGRAAEPSGVGAYIFGHTTFAQIHDGNCSPTDDVGGGRKGTWCTLLPPIKVGTKVADVDAYFLGTEKDAPLIELELKVRGCVEDEADRWMRARFGPPYATKSTREFWKNSFLWAKAELPSEPARCVIRFLPIGETAEIQRLEAK